MFSVSVKWRRGGQDRSLTVWMPPQSPQMSDAGVETRPPSQVRESHSLPTEFRHLLMKVPSYNPNSRTCMMHVQFYYK